MWYNAFYDDIRYKSEYKNREGIMRYCVHFSIRGDAEKYVTVGAENQKLAIDMVTRYLWRVYSITTPAEYQIISVVPI